MDIKQILRTLDKASKDEQNVIKNNGLKEAAIMSEVDERRGGGDEKTTANAGLGQYLASIRSDRGLSLRAVEDKTRKQVSNAYLSQIENGKIQQPSPNILHALAELYEINFENLMERAGYITPSSARNQGERHGRVATFAEHHLTPAEEAELLAFLEFMRKRPG